MALDVVFGHPVFVLQGVPASSAVAQQPLYYGGTARTWRSTTGPVPLGTLYFAATPTVRTEQRAAPREVTARLLLLLD